jgi:RNA polymerase sigma-70 factor, ECF subfamily
MEAAGCLGELYSECFRASGPHPACEKFFEIFRPVLRRIAYRVAAQFSAIEEIEDVTQEISLKLAAKDPSVLAGMPTEPSASTAYFSVIAANAARDYFRARNAIKRGFGRTIPIEESLALVTEGMDSKLESDLLISQLEDFMPLDARMRSVSRLYFRQGFSAKEIAAIPALELSIKGVESVIHRAVLYIRERIAKREGNTVREDAD